MATLKSGTTIGGNVAWHAGNDGASSGLDADTLDGLHASELGVAQIAASSPSVRGAGDLWASSTAASSASTGISVHDDAWTNLTLASPWTNYGSGYEPARFRRTIDGLLILGGLIRANTSGWATTCATLPVGYRPQYNLIVVSLNDNWLNRLNIYADGRIVPEKQTSGTDWASLRVVIWVGG